MVDTPALGAGERKLVEVQVLSRPPRPYIDIQQKKYNNMLHSESQYVKQSHVR